MMTSGKDSRRGFTLIELLLVLSIILLLVSILAVSVTPTSQGAVVAQKRMDALALALNAYRNVFGVYPPSNNKVDHLAPTYGAQCLYYYLMGPLGSDQKPHGWPGAASPVKGQSVAPEFAWQGAMNVSNDWVTSPIAYSGKAYFNDGIPGTDRAILYYRAAWKDANGYPLGSTMSPTSSIGLTNYYSYADNEDTTNNSTGGEYDSPFWSNYVPTGCGLPTKQVQWQNEITDWTKTAASTTNQSDVNTAMAVTLRFPANSNSYLLISAGLDREFGLPSDQTHGWASDDIFNFGR